LDLELFKAVSTHSFLKRKKTQRVTIKEMKLFMLVREKFAAHSESNMKSVSTLCGHDAELLNVKTGGMYNHHSALKV
jgi:hypothetical protein